MWRMPDRIELRYPRRYNPRKKRMWRVIAFHAMAFGTVIVSVLIARGIVAYVAFICRGLKVD